jgi:hypothetical protein
VTDSPTVTFRLPFTALIGVFALIVCMTPTAFGVPGLQVLYLVPLTLGVWLVRTRTTVGPDTVVAYRVRSSRRISWSELAGLRGGGRAARGTRARPSRPSGAQQGVATRLAGRSR